MAETVVLVTGANQGIGLALARLFAKRQNYSVIGTCRDLAKSADLAGAGCKVVELDVASDESCNGLVERLSKQGVTKLDDNNLGSPTLIADTLAQLNTNSLGPLRVTSAVLPMLRKSVAENGRPAKIVNISSRMGSIGDNTSGRFYGYRASKAALNAISVTLARDLAKDNILSLTLHPGMISTRMLGTKGDMEPDECATRLSKLIDNATKEDCFKFIHRDGAVLPW